MSDGKRSLTTRAAVLLTFALSLGAWPGPIGRCHAELRLPRVLGSQMVLQREAEVEIWGWADPAATVTLVCDWLDTRLETKADDQGRWSFSLRTGKAGGPHRLTVASGDDRVLLEDVLFGEVWIGSGQSNMEMPLVKVSGAYTGIDRAEQEVAAADHPQIRLFQAGNFSSKTPLEDVEPGITMYGIPPARCQWQVCSPETVPHFSSTAYFFARQLHRELDVPIGIIDASWGGTPAEAWTPREGLERLGYEGELKQAAELPQKPDQKIPTRLYNGMIHPLRKLTIRGVIWYQGEGNARRADKYRELFSTMIAEWRRAFDRDFSFYFVQIAPYNYQGLNAALLREAQLQTLATPGTGMAVTMDIGDREDIHPKNKQEVGRRLALWALAKDYDRDVAFSGPLPREASFADGEARVEFEHAQGLTTSDGRPPSHLELAGADGKFHSAVGRIEGETLVVTSPQVESPEKVRYAFSSDAMPNLVNGTGLPAPSFRR